MCAAAPCPNCSLGIHGRLPYPYPCKQNVLVMVPLVKTVILEQDSHIWGWKGSLTAVTEQIETRLNTKHKSFINLEEKQPKRDLRFSFYYSGSCYLVIRQQFVFLLKLTLWYSQMTLKMRPYIGWVVLFKANIVS